jgi:hypothetical protein
LRAIGAPEFDHKGVTAETGDITIRKAESADVDYAADVIYLASPDLFDYLYETASNCATEFIRHGFSLNRCSDPSANLPDARRMVLEVDPGNA